MTEQAQGTLAKVASANAFFDPDGLVVDYGAAKAALLNVAKAGSATMVLRQRLASPPASAQTPCASR